MGGRYPITQLPIPLLVERIVERYDLCRPEDNHWHGDYTFDHGHTDCWLLGQVIEHLAIAERVIELTTHEAAGTVTWGERHFSVRCDPELIGHLLNGNVS